MPNQNITLPPISDKTGRKLVDKVKEVSILPNTGLSIVNGKLCVSFTVDDYDEDKVDGYKVGDFCQNNNLLMVCINPTSGVYDSNDWDQFFRNYDADDLDGYDVDDIVVYSGVQKICISPTSGPYDSTKWANL